MPWGRCPLSIPATGGGGAHAPVYTCHGATAPHFYIHWGPLHPPLFFFSFFFFFFFCHGGRCTPFNTCQRGTMLLYLPWGHCTPFFHAMGLGPLHPFQYPPCFCTCHGATAPHFFFFFFFFFSCHGATAPIFPCMGPLHPDYTCQGATAARLYLP